MNPKRGLPLCWVKQNIFWGEAQSMGLQQEKDNSLIGTKIGSLSFFWGVFDYRFSLWLQLAVSTQSFHQDSANCVSHSQPCNIDSNTCFGGSLGSSYFKSVQQESRTLPYWIEVHVQHLQFHHFDAQLLKSKTMHTFRLNHHRGSNIEYSVLGMLP